jgi:two-component system LytT family sensor kinase
MKMGHRPGVNIAMIWGGLRQSIDLLRRPSRGREEWGMPQGWKSFFSLDFAREYVRSFLKLLFIVNPLWTFGVSFFSGEKSINSIFFRWGWDFLEATLVCLLGMGVIRAYLEAERIWISWSGRDKPRHGTGWYLLFLAFLIPPGLVLALHWMVSLINWFYIGPAIEPRFQWFYYGKEIFGGWLLLLICFFFKSWQDLRDAVAAGQLKAEEMEKERLQALLTKLKDQMNPHFLFNTLNTVAALIPADPNQAERVVVKLSGLFQAVLAASRKTTHSLAQELEFCRDYLEIEQARFGTRLKVKMQAGNDREKETIQLPVLILQPLVENAVKHGLSSRAHGGSLWVGYAREGAGLKIWVEDDGVGFGNSSYRGSGTALENCRKRLELSYGNGATIDIFPRKPEGTRVVMNLPGMAPDLENEAT